MLRTSDLPRALSMLEGVSIVICERDLASGSWIDMLHHLRQRADPPLLIVTSRLADERLWAEALNLGAWDVLAKPLAVGEVTRSLEHALRHWGSRAPAMSAHSALG